VALVTGAASGIGKAIAGRRGGLAVSGLKAHRDGRDLPRDPWPGSATRRPQSAWPGANHGCGRDPSRPPIPLNRGAAGAASHRPLTTQRKTRNWGCQRRCGELLRDAGQETATAVLPSFLSSVLHASPAALGLVEGSATCYRGSEPGRGSLADEPRPAGARPAQHVPIRHRARLTKGARRRMRSPSTATADGLHPQSQWRQAMTSDHDEPDPSSNLDGPDRRDTVEMTQNYLAGETSLLLERLQIWAGDHACGRT
jgi:hypothetical protein